MNVQRFEVLLWDRAMLNEVGIRPRWLETRPVNVYPATINRRVR